MKGVRHREPLAVHFGALLLVSFAFGCMNGPRDGQAVASQTAELSFEGFFPGERELIAVEQHRYTDGSWEALGFVPVDAGSSVTDAAGTPWYRWSQRLRLSQLDRHWRWSDGFQLTTRVRARGMRSGIVLHVFPQGADDCWSEHASEGGLGMISACSSGRSAQLVLPDQLRGDTRVRWGDAGANRCVHDVEARYLGLGHRPHPTGRYRYRAQEGRSLPPHGYVMTHFNTTDHVQGFNRLALDQGRWLVGTKSMDYSRAGFWLARISEGVANGGEPLTAASGDIGETRYHYRISATNHVGGFQLAGHVMAFAAECGDHGGPFDWVDGDDYEDCVAMHGGRHAFVDLWDLSEPADARKLQRLVLQDQEPFRSTGDEARAAAVALTRLDNGRYLMFVVGRRSAVGWFYVSDSREITSGTEWIFEGEWRAADALPSGTDSWDNMPQNIAFVTDCASGGLYLFSMGETDGRQRFHLWRVSSPDDRAVELERVGWSELQVGPNGYCDLRGGAGVYVTPMGRMVLHCSSRATGNGDLKLEQYTM